MTKDFKISSDDIEVWLQVSKTVDVLQNKEVFNPDKIQKFCLQNNLFEDGHIKNQKSEKAIYTDNSSLTDLFQSRNNFKNIQNKPDDHSLGNVKDLDKSTAKKIISGKFTADATLDLHGMSQRDALEIIHKFIKNNFALQKRKLIIITGKGIDNKGILKQKTPAWLNYSGIKELILLFSYAKYKDGGKGALYVLLRRKK